MAAMPHKERSRTQAENDRKRRENIVEEEAIGLSDSDDLAYEVEEQEDGSAVVREPNTKGPLEAPDFYDNLAAEMDQDELDMLAMEYLNYVKSDKMARSRRDELYEEGLRRTGMGSDAPGGAQFQGASKVVHPVMAESCVDFSAAAMKELFPADGPVRTAIFGKENRHKQEKAERKRDFMNWQLTEQIPEYADELEQLTTQLPLGGSQYFKFWYDHKLRRIRCEFVPIDNILLPFSASGFSHTPRYTEIQEITENDFKDRVDSGEYLDVEFQSNMMTHDRNVIEKTQAEMANDKIEGREENDNVDGLRNVYYVYTQLQIDDSKASDEGAPYVLILDDQTQKVLGIYRNWEDGDEEQERLDWHAEYRFIPWRGAYGIGFPHLIGGLSAALTGALRALLDSAHINNSPSLLKLKGAKISGQSQSVDPTQISEIEGAPGVDDIKKIAMPYPYNPPSSVLVDLLGWCTAAAKGVVTTAEEKIQDLDSTAPVGTAQAMIEQGSKVFSAIHARMHRSQKMALRIIQRLNRWYLDDMKLGEAGKEFGVEPEDFTVMNDVVPVTDPTIFSETQRYAQVQATLQLMSMNPQIYNQVEVHKMALKQIRIPDVDRILIGSNEPTEMNPALENVAMAFGKHAAAFQHQDHLAHLQAHLSFYQDPMFGSSPNIAPTFIPGFVEHCKQHIMMFYLQSMEHHIGDEGVHKVMATSRGSDRVFAAASRLVSQDSQQALSGIMPVLQQALQQLQQAQQGNGMANLPPEAKVLQETAKAETDRKAQADQMKKETDDQKLQIEQLKLQLKEQELAQKAQLEQQKLSTQVQQKHQDMQNQANLKLMDHKAQGQQQMRQHQLEMAKGGIVHQQQLQAKQQDHAHRMAEGGAVHGRNVEMEGMKADHQHQQGEFQRNHDKTMKDADRQHQMEMGMANVVFKDAGDEQTHSRAMQQKKMDQDHQLGLERFKASNVMDMEGMKQQHAGQQAKLDRQHQTNTTKMQQSHDMDKTKMSQDHDTEKTVMQQKFEQARMKQEAKQSKQQPKSKK